MVNWHRPDIPMHSQVHREVVQVQLHQSGNYNIHIQILKRYHENLWLFTHPLQSTKKKKKHKLLLLLSVYIIANRKISAHEFERGGLLKPIVNTIDGTPTFLSVYSHNDSALGSTTITNNSTSSHQRPQRLSRTELKHLDEKQLIFELVHHT